MRDAIVQPSVHLNPGESIDKLSYDFEREFLLDRSVLAAGQILSLYLIFTPTRSKNSIYGVYDVFVREFYPYYDEDYIEAMEENKYPWDVDYFFNPNKLAHTDGSPKPQNYSLVADTISVQSALRDPARLGDTGSGFFGNRREYRGKPTPSFGREAMMEITNV